MTLKNGSIALTIIKNTALQLQSSVGTALARASTKITQLVADALPAARHTRTENHKITRDALIIPIGQSYICGVSLTHRQENKKFPTC